MKTVIGEASVSPLLPDEDVKAIAALGEIAGRPVFITFGEGSQKHQFLLEPASMKYQEVPTRFGRKESVSNIESLVALVRSEFARQESHDLGRFMTVSFGQMGAKFQTDVRYCTDEFTFGRTLSPQFELLLNACKVPGFDHKGFLRLLQQFKPSIAGFKDLYREYRKVSFDSRTKVISAPILDRGEAGSSIAINFAARGSNAAGGETRLPAEIQMEMQFARGSTKLYKFEVEIDCTLEGKTPEDQGLVFRLVFVERDIVMEKAIDDEIRLFEKEVKGEIPNLLILRDF